MARLTITMLGGVCWPPSAARSSDSTTTTRVNEVTMMRMPGASDRTVSSAMICSRRPVLAPVAPSPRSSVDALRRGGKRRQAHQREAGEAEETAKRHGFGSSSASVVAKLAGALMPRSRRRSRRSGRRSRDARRRRAGSASVLWRGPSICTSDDAEAAALGHFHAHAETAQHPGEQGDQPQDQDRAPGRT